MAAKITHLEVFRQSLYLLEHGTERQNNIAKLLSAKEISSFASFGSIAPDIFYFYHVFSKRKNALAQFWGNAIHHRKVFELWFEFLNRIKVVENAVIREKLLAFALGYVSHCAVDIVTHPYIFYITGDYYSNDEQTATEAQENHLRVEYALDAYLVDNRWGLSPRSYNFLQYVDCREIDRETGEVRLDHDIWSMWVNSLATVFKDDFEKHYFGSTEKMFPGDIVNDSYLGFIKINKLLDTRSRLTRFFLNAIDTVTFHRVKTRYLILPPKENIDIRLPNEGKVQWKYPANPSMTSNESFMDLVHRAAKFSAQMMNDAYDYIDGKKKGRDLEKLYLGYNLDTGLRSESTTMIEFSTIKEED